MSTDFSFSTNASTALTETINLDTDVTGVSLTVEFSDRQDFATIRVSKTVTGSGKTASVTLSASDVETLHGGFHRIKNGSTVIASGRVYYSPSPAIPPVGGLTGAEIAADSTVVAAFRPDRYYAKANGGCKGDGVTDDTAAISAAMDAANAAGQVLFFEPGNYVSARITKSYAPNINAAPGVTVTVASSVTNGWLWTFQGAIGSHVNLTANMNQRSFTLPVNTTGWNANDLLLVGSNALVPDEGYPATVAPRYVGQLSEIQSVDSASQATLFESAYTNFLTTDTAFAAKVTPIENPRVLGGIKFVNPYRATKAIGFLYFLYARNVEFDVQGDGASAAGVQLAHCYRVTGRSRHRNYRDEGGNGYYGYGVLVSGSTAHGEFDITQVGGVGNAFNTTGLDNDWGEPNDHLITGSAAGGTGGFSTHPAGRNITFKNCHVSGIGKGFAFGVRADGVRIVGCTVDRAGGGVWLFDNARNVLIQDCRFREIYDSGDSSANGRGILFTQTAAAGERNIVIRGNTFIGVDRACVFLSDNANSLTGVEITSNQFKNFGRLGTTDTDWSAIYSQAGTGLARCVIRDNVASDSQGSPTGKYLCNFNSATATAEVYGNDVRDGIALTNRVLQGANRRFGFNTIAGKPSSVTLSDYTGISSGTLDCLTSDIFYIPLTAARTLVLSNPTQGQMIEIHLQQDATGSRTVTWPASVLFPGGTAPTLTTTANKTDIIRLRYRGSNWYFLGSTLNM